MEIDSYVIPDAVRFMCRRLIENSQPSVNTLRVNPLNSTTTKGGGLMIVRLPLGMVDLNTFAWTFQPVVSPGADTATGAFVDGILPSAERLIQRLEVVLNGMSISNFPNYGLLAGVLHDQMDTSARKLSRGILQNDVDAAPISSSSMTPITIGNWTASTSGTALTVVGYSPVKLDSGLVGSTAYRAPPAAFFGFSNDSVALTAAPTFTYDNQYATFTLPTSGNTPATGCAQVTLTYTLASGTWTGTAAASAPFTFFTNPDNSAPSVNFYAPNQGTQTVSDWLVFFNSQSPRIVNTSAIAEIEVRITLQNNDVLGLYPVAQTTTTYSKATAYNKISSQPTYQLENQFFSISTISFNTGFADDILAMELGEGHIVEMPFHNAVSIQQVQSSGTSSTRFSVNSTSLDKVIGVNRMPNYGSPQMRSVLIPAGYSRTTNDTFGLVYRPANFATYCGNPSLFSFGVPRGSGAGTFNEFFYTVNNQIVPNYRIQPLEAYHYSQMAFGIQNDLSAGACFGSLPIYLNCGYAMAINLALLDHEGDAGDVFGIDSRGASAVFYLQQSQGNTGDETSVFSLFTSVLRVAGNQQISVVL
jgi:hypothetical protein